ncbi:WLM domain-containing protein [Schizophyllum commune]
MSSELRYTANTQLEHLHARYTGTGHADISKYEWLTHQHRDTLASIVGHPPLTSYLAIADGEPIARIKFEMTEVTDGSELAEKFCVSSPPGFYGRVAGLWASLAILTATMARIPNLSASTDSYVRTITHLKDRPRGDEALDMLKRVASLAKPIMRKRNWHLPTLGEFLPDDPNLLDVNRGHQIFLRLRPAANPSTFYDLEFVMGTMLHELTHNHRGPHDEVFYKYLDGLEDEYAALKRSGYAGEGFYSRGRVLGGPGTGRGQRLGGRGVGMGAGTRLGGKAGGPGYATGSGGRAVGSGAGGTGRVLGGPTGASASDKRRAAEAAEKRRQGARVLGGPTRAPLSPREAAAQAAIRRVRDSHSCASAAQGQAQQEAQKATQASEVIDLTLEDDKFDYNDFVFDDDDIMIVDDGNPLVVGGDTNTKVSENEAGPSNRPAQRPAIDVSKINPDDFIFDEDDIMIVEDEAGPSHNPGRRSTKDEDEDDIEIVFDGTVKQKFATNVARPGHPRQRHNGPQANSTSRPSEKIPPSRQWTCAICTLVNDEKASQCDACAALRPAPPKADHWTCLRFCGFVKTKS